MWRSAPGVGRCTLDPEALRAPISRAYVTHLKMFCCGVTEILLWARYWGALADGQYTAVVTILAVCTAEVDQQSIKCSVFKSTTFSFYSFHEQPMLCVDSLFNVRTTTTVTDLYFCHCVCRTYPTHSVFLSMQVSISYAININVNTLQL